MSSSTSTTEAIKFEISDFFQPIDNIQRDTEQETELILSAKANLLVRSAIGTGKLSRLLGQPEPQDNRYKFEKGKEIEIILPAKIEIEQPVIDFKKYSFHYPYKLTSVLIYKTKTPVLHHSIESACRPYMKEIAGSRKMYCPSYYTTSKESQRDDIFKYVPKEFQHSGVIAIIGNESECFSAAVKALSKHTIIDIFSRTNTKVNIDRVFSILNSDKKAYACFKTVDNNFKHSPFFEYDEKNKFGKYKLSHGNEPKLQMMENIVRDFLKDPSFEYHLDESLEAADEDCYKAAYAFRDKEGDVQQVAVKVFDWQRQSKLIIPCTAWPEDGQPMPLHLPIPLPSGKQILFNLDKLTSRPQATVILADSIELADLNQSDRNHKGFVWTSWLCEEGAYDQVDWSPLKGKNIFVLITNHSGLSIPEQFLKIKGLVDFLNDKLPETPALNFIMARTGYGEKKYAFASIHEFADHWEKHEPALIPESVKILTMEEFLDFHKKAGAKLQLMERPLEAMDSISESESAKESSSENKSVAPNTKNIPNEYLLRPIIKKGDITFMFAQEGIGKSALSMSICASIIFGKTLFEEVWWTVPNSVGKKTKVLYIDFEHSRTDFNKRKKKFFDPYAPDDKIKREQLDKNFKEVLINEEKEINLFQETGHDFIMNKVKELKNTGDENVQVGLVVIDTYTEMLGGTHETISDWDNIYPLIKKLRSKDISVLILDHLNSDGEPQGHAGKRRKTQFTIEMIKDKGVERSIETPTKMDPDKTKSSESIIDKTKFYFCFNPDAKKWTVLSIEGDKWGNIDKADYQKEFFCDLAKLCDKGKFNKDAFADMLGMSPNTYRNLCDEYGISKKAKQPTTPP